MKSIMRFAFLALIPPTATPLVGPPAFAQSRPTVTISQPPAAGAAGSTFSITETVWNSGTSPSGSGTQTLWLVPVGAGAALTLGTRNVPGLPGGALSTATTTVTIPANAPAGTYVIGAGSAGCAGNCLKSTGTIAVTAAPVTVTVTVFVSGSGAVSGGLESGVYQGQHFQNCSQSGGLGCVTSGPAGSAFVLSATPGTVPASGAFGQARPATFAGWKGCTGTAQGTTGLRVVANTSITCTAQFK
ncbi:MAG: hypothetical protein HY704_13675 [Gemmatimonadetes bacterium]|nr:hypothetical protein [Gemmatimonadota bacterium]